MLPSELSVGMQKRVGLIRGTILNQKLTLFDEPTAGLDPINIQLFIDRIQSIKKDRLSSAIVVTHDFSVARCVCDRLAVLWEGRLKVIATPKELQDSNDPIVKSFVMPPYQGAQCTRSYQGWQSSRGWDNGRERCSNQR